MEARPAERWTVHTDVFDGPLDLLLYLVKRDGIALERLSVALIADSYLAYLDRMRELDLAIAGDYLVMAATLIHIKSLGLLPRMPALLEAEEEEDPRDALARRLVEYEQLRVAADALEHRSIVGRDVFVREPVEIDGGERSIVAGVDAFGLLDLYWELLRREPASEPVHQVAATGVDFATCARTVIARLAASGGRFELGELLRALVTRVERVITFLAVLEMARLRWIELLQQRHLGAVEIGALVAYDRIDLGAVAGWVEAG